MNMLNCCSLPFDHKVFILGNHCETVALISKRICRKENGIIIFSRQFKELKAR